MWSLIKKAGLKVPLIFLNKKLFFPLIVSFSTHYGVFCLPLTSILLWAQDTLRESTVLHKARDPTMWQGPILQLLDSPYSHCTSVLLPGWW